MDKLLVLLLLATKWTVTRRDDAIEEWRRDGAGRSSILAESACCDDLTRRGRLIALTRLACLQAPPALTSTTLDVGERLGLLRSAEALRDRALLLESASGRSEDDPAREYAATVLREQADTLIEAAGVSPAAWRLVCGQEGVA